MNDQSPIDTELRQIPLADLTLSDLNTRSEPPDAEIDHLANSLAMSGLLQNLLGYDDGSGAIEIVAGGRRLRALQLLASENWSRFAQTTRTDPVPVRVTNDPLVAQAWASTENEARADLHPADQIRAYAELAEKGLPADTIALAFGQTERHVKGRLALAQLPQPALDALRAGKITLDLCKRMTTIATDEPRLERVLELATETNPASWQVDRALNDGQITIADRRAKFVGLDTYKAEGGAITEDLFGDRTVLHDEDLLQRLFKIALEAAADRIADEQGWSWAKPVMEDYVGYELRENYDTIFKTPGELPEADQDDFDRLEELYAEDAIDEEGLKRLEELEARLEGDYTDEDRATCGVFVYIDTKGDLKTSNAYRAKSKDATDSGASGKPDKKTAPPISQAAIDDIRAIETMAYQHALLDKPELLLDLLAFQLENGRPTYDNALDISISNGTELPAADAGDSLIVDQRWRDTSNNVIGDMMNDIADDFVTFRNKGKKHRNAVLTCHLARAFQRPAFQTAPLGKLLTQELGVNPRKHWTPDADVLFKRCSAARLNDFYAELLQLAENDERRAAFGKLKKSEKAKALHDLMHDASVQEATGLSRDDIQRIDNWMPEVDA